MAELATIARPYAQALYSLAQAQDKDAWADFMAELAAISSHKEIQAFAEHPKCDKQKIMDLLLTLVKSKAPIEAHAKRFIKLLLDNSRLSLLPEIATQFAALRDAAQNIGAAEIRTPFPLEQEQLATLLSALEKKFGKKLRPNVTVDRNLIGGIRVQVGDEVLDTSVRTRLAQMQSTLLTA